VNTLGNHHDKTVLFLLHGYYPNDPRVRRQAEALLRTGFDVQVICTSDNSKARRWECDGVKVTEVALAKSRGGILAYGYQYIRMAQLCWRAVREFCSERLPAFVQVATLPDFLIWGALPARRKGVPIVLDLHESMPDFFSSKYPGPLSRFVSRPLRLLEKHCADLADELLTVNDEIASVLEARLGRRPRVILNTVDERIFPWRRSSVAWDSGPKNLAYHGTITSIYGLDLVLQALPGVLAAHPNTRFHIIGDGPAKSELELLTQELGISEAVRFHGSVPLKDISDTLKTIHLGIVPTRKDKFLTMSLATKLLEYVYLGIPVVASDLAAVKRHFGPGKHLYLFESNNSRDLQNVLLRALDAGKAEIQSRVSAATEIYDSIAWPEMQKKYIAFARSLAGETTP